MDSWYSNILSTYNQGSPASLLPGSSNLPMSPQDVQRRRLAQAMMDRRRGGASQALPTTFGGGLTSLGEGLGDRLQTNRLVNPAVGQMSIGDQLSNMFG